MSDWIEITMKFDSKCNECEEPMPEGTRGLWQKGQGVKHVKCEGEVTTYETKASKEHEKKSSVELFDETKYPYAVPKPLIIELNGPDNIEIRKRANDYIEENWNQGQMFNSVMSNERKSEEQKKLEIKKGMLAQMVVRNAVGLEEIDDNQPLHTDMKNQHGVIMDIKMEGITIAFQEEYGGSGGVKREAKHNFYARQLHDPNLQATDIFINTRFRTGDTFPGSGRRNETKWVLWICGWVSKKRVIKEGVLIPRGGITEQGQKFFDYRSHNVEFYQHALNGIVDLREWFKNLTNDDVRIDEQKDPNATPQCTTADRQRILGSLVSRGILSYDKFISINDKILELKDVFVPPILHDNHTIRYVKHLIHIGVLDESVLSKMQIAKIHETKPQDLDELQRFFQDNT